MADYKLCMIKERFYVLVMEFTGVYHFVQPEQCHIGRNWAKTGNEETVCALAYSAHLFETQQFDFKDKFTVGHDSPCRKSPTSVGIIRRAGEFGDFALRHGEDALVPSLDDLSHPHGKGKSGLTRILCG